MINKYLINKILKYDFLKIIILSMLIFLSSLTGRYFQLNGWSGVVVGLIEGLLGGIVLLGIEYFSKKQSYYLKGLDLENKIADKLSKLNYDFERNLNTGYGDLDFLVQKNYIYYGVEAKNIPGLVIFKNGLLKVDGFDKSEFITKLLSHCRLVRDERFGEKSEKWINPILVFGHKTVVNIPNNKIHFNNTEIVVTTIKDFEKFIK